ncbi:MAG TPA: IS1634 family transposase [Defluviitaleaceae bacterium]|jgi:transposase|nr:IS1634 family transposase [Defluviitaleaceae bacterium]
MAFRLDISERKKGTYLKIEKKYWDKEKKQARTKHHETLGYLHDLQNQYPDPIAHFKQVVEQMNIEEKENRLINMTIDMNEELPQDSRMRYNFGYAVILKIYYQLELNRFFNNKARHELFQYNTNSIMTLFTISRILKPSSIRRAFLNKGDFFERFDFELHDVYRSLSHFAEVGLECQKFISDMIVKKYGRNTKLMYFDVTNFYFEIDQADDFRKFGKNKEGRSDPIVQMALAMDADGIPLYYKLFPGNVHDSKTFIPAFKDVCVKFNPGRVIAVADMGCTSADNIFFLKGGDRDKRHHGYVFSYSIHKSTKDFKKYVLDESGYTDLDGNTPAEDCDFKFKSRIDVREIHVTMENGCKKKYLIDEKQVVYWSGKYARKAKAEREEAISRAKAIIENPSKYNKTTAHKAQSYIKNIKFDKETGEIIEKEGEKLIFDSEKAKEDAKYDGYYCLISSELNMPATRIIEIYRGLSEIEDNFKVSKSDLDLRPVFVSKKDHINAHALICFIALVIIRLMQKETKYMFTPEQIITCLNNISCSHENDNLYLFDYRSYISDEIGKVFDIDFTKKRLLLKDIKKVLATAKK